MAEETQSPQGPSFTRRRLFGAAAATGGAAMAAMALPPTSRRLWQRPCRASSPR